jgi:type II secretory pathway pseudopilin PulG
MLNFRRVFFCAASLLIIYTIIYVLIPCVAIANSNQNQQQSQQRAQREQQQRQMAQQRAQREQQQREIEKQNKAKDKEKKNIQVQKNADKNNKNVKSNTKVSSNLVKKGTGPYADNCVLYLRDVKGIKLPKKDLSSWSAKKSIINSQKPKKGCVAVIKESGEYAEIGHVAEVISVNKNELVLQEANSDGHGGYFTRTIKGNNIKDMMASNNIEGFYDPSKK